MWRAQCEAVRVWQAGGRGTGGSPQTHLISFQRSAFLREVEALENFFAPSARSLAFVSMSSMLRAAKRCA